MSYFFWIPAFEVYNGWILVKGFFLQGLEGIEEDEETRNKREKTEKKASRGKFVETKGITGREALIVVVLYGSIEPGI